METSHCGFGLGTKSDPKVSKCNCYNRIYFDTQHDIPTSHLGVKWSNPGYSTGVGVISMGAEFLTEGVDISRHSFLLLEQIFSPGMGSVMCPNPLRLSKTKKRLPKWWGISLSTNSTEDQGHKKVRKQRAHNEKDECRGVIKGGSNCTLFKCFSPQIHDAPFYLLVVGM